MNSGHACRSRCGLRCVADSGGGGGLPFFSCFFERPWAEIIQIYFLTRRLLQRLKPVDNLCQPINLTEELAVRARHMDVERGRAWDEPNRPFPSLARKSFLLARKQLISFSECIDFTLRKAPAPKCLSPASLSVTGRFGSVTFPLARGPYGRIPNRNREFHNNNSTQYTIINQDE